MDQELIKKLIHDLREHRPEPVRSAAHALVSIGQPVLAPLLRAFVQHTMSPVDVFKTNAVEVLKQMQPDETLPSLMELLESDVLPAQSKTLLTEVLLTLLEDNSSNESVFQVLVHLLQSSEELLRVWATRVLGKMVPTRSVPLLRRLLQDDAAAVREEAQRQLALLPYTTEDEIPAWDPASFAAMARLRVRNGLSPSRRDAIETVLEKGHAATSELLPFLEDAGEQTLEEMSPVFKRLESEQAIHTVTQIAKSPLQVPSRRLAALRILKILQPEPAQQEGLYRQLVGDDQPEVRGFVLDGLLRRLEADGAEAKGEERTKLLAYAGMLLGDTQESLRYQMAMLLADVVKPTDQVVLRHVLDALHRFSQERSRVYLIQALSRLLKNSPNTQFLLPDILDFVKDSRGDALLAGLALLDTVIPVRSSPLASDVLLRMIENAEDVQVVEALLVLLLRVLPRNYAVASEVICSLESRFPGQALWESVLQLCGRICDQRSLDTLIRWTQQEGEDERSQALHNMARQILDDLDGTLREVWKSPDGRYVHRPGAICECGGKLSWQLRNPREELHCEECDTEYVLGKNGNFLPVRDVQALLCSCSGCRRKQMLSLLPDGIYLCPASGELYVPRFDTKQLLRISSLPLGVCQCCQPPQPLEKVSGRVVCIQTKRGVHEVRNRDTLPVIDTLDIPAFQMPTQTGPAQRPTPTSLPTMRVMQLRKDMMTTLAESDPDQDDIQDKKTS